MAPTTRKVYLDENVDVEVAIRLAALGVDAITAKDAGMLAMSDGSQLDFATAQSRVLFTHDLRDFTALSKERWIARQDHAGIMYSSEATPYAIARWIVAALEMYPDMANLVIALPPADVTTS